MSKRIVNKGDILGDLGSFVIEEIEPRLKGKKQVKQRQVKMVCGICKKEYITDLRFDKKYWCCSDCAKKQLANKRAKKHYITGQILNNITRSSLVRLTYRDSHSNQYGIVKCGICGNEYETKLSTVEQGTICKKCHLQKMHETKKLYRPNDIIFSSQGLAFLFQKEVEPQISTTRKTRCGIFVQVDKDTGEEIGQPFYAQLGHILSGHCLGGVRSNGEMAFENALKELGYLYYREYSFSDLRSTKNSLLRFDFMIPLKNNSKLLVELDGLQHYRPVELFGGEQEFQELQIRDSLKNQYINKHKNLFLIRIPYWDYPNINANFIKELIIKQYEPITV